MTRDLPRFSETVSLFVLDETGVVFDEKAQEIFELNATATYIWCLLDDGVPADEIAGGLSQTFSFSLPEAQKVVRETLDDWKSQGFFDAHPRQVAAPQSAKPSSRIKSFASTLSKAVLRPRSAPTSAVKRCYRSFDTVTCVTYANAVIERWVHPVLAHIEVPPEDIRREADDLQVHSDGKAWMILQNGREITRCTSDSEVAPVVRYLVHFAGIKKKGWSVAFHAGAVSDGSRILVLPGKAGSGKTSLTAALVHAGYRYLSDDLVLMQEDLTIEGVPFSLSVKESGVALLAPYFPDLRALPTHLRRDKKRLRYLPLASIPTETRSDLPTAWVVFPTYQASGPSQLTPLTVSEALRRLLSCCTLSLPLNKHQVGNFVRWLRGAECYALSIDSLTEAVARINSLIAEGKATELGR
jgi:hypothetical protein